METSLKTGFAQIFSRCPKNLSCPKFGGAAALLAPPARTPMNPKFESTTLQSHTQLLSACLASFAFDRINETPDSAATIRRTTATKQAVRRMKKANTILLVHSVRKIKIFAAFIAKCQLTVLHVASYTVVSV